MKRPNKLAQGMTDTWERTKQSRAGWALRPQLSDSALSLVVKGTTDALNWTRHHSYVTWEPATACPCCGHARKVQRLNDKGRRKLIKWRARQ